MKKGENYFKTSVIGLDEKSVIVTCRGAEMGSDKTFGAGCHHGGSKTNEKE